MVLSARPGGNRPPAAPQVGGAPRPGAAPQQAAPQQAAPQQAAPQQAAPAARPGFRPGASPQAQERVVDISDPAYNQPQQAAPQPQAAPAFRQPSQQQPPARAAQPPVNAGPPAVRQPQQTAVSTQVGGGPAPKIADLNPMLGGLDGIGENNRVGITQAGFEYKATQQFVQELNIVISGGTKLWQKWGDATKGEDEGLCQSYDHKTSTEGLVCATCPFFKDKSCKFKFEVRWMEPEDDGEGGMIEKEMIWTMPTATALTWLDYLKELAKNLGVGAHQVNTRVNYEIKRSGNNLYACGMFTPTHYYNAETGEYTEIPAAQQFTTVNKNGGK